MTRHSQTAPVALGRTITPRPPPPTCAGCDAPLGAAAPPTCYASRTDRELNAARARLARREPALARARTAAELRRAVAALERLASSPRWEDAAAWLEARRLTRRGRP